MLFLRHIPLAVMFLCIGNAAAAPGKRPAGPPPLVIVEPVSELSQTAPKEYIGSIVANSEVELPSRISGFITGVKFKEGSLVKKGDLLFTIEDTTYRAKAQAAKAKVAQNEAELQYAQSNFVRQKKLASKSAISLSKYEDAQRLLDYQKAKCQESEAELLDAMNNLSYTKIYAPISGRIGENKHSAGNYVCPSSTPLATIVSVNPILIKFAVSERDFQNLFKDASNPNPNLHILIRLANGASYPHQGKIDFIDNMVDSSTGTIAVWAEFQNPELKLIPGGYVTVLLSETLKKKIMGVKLSAVLTDNSGNFVYIVDKDNKVVRRNVQLGDVIGNLNIIRSGLNKGDMVIISGVSKVRPGSLVKPLQAGKK